MEKHWIQDKVAIITGGASGIGQGIAYLAAKLGAWVVIVDIDDTKGKETVDNIIKAGGSAIYCHTDVTSSSSIERMVMEAEQFGPIKYLANSAGLQTYGTAESTSEEVWDKTLGREFEKYFFGKSTGNPTNSKKQWRWDREYKFASRFKVSKECPCLRNFKGCSNCTYPINGS